MRHVICRDRYSLMKKKRLGRKRDFDYALAVQLYKSGLSQSQVGLKLGCTQSAVYHILKKMKVPGRADYAAGARNSRWNGGRKADGGGYMMIWLPEHANADAAGYIYEHRLVMSQMLGRPLKRKEVVHHKNKNRMDNRPENLELFRSNAEHLRAELTGSQQDHSKQREKERKLKHDRK